MALFWLSFVDPESAPGERFLGACLVKAASFEEAMSEAWRLGCNPGGECAPTVAHPGLEEHVLDSELGVLYRDKDECQRVTDTIEKRAVKTMETN